jgi:hypothetical protein
LSVRNARPRLDDDTDYSRVPQCTRDAAGFIMPFDQWLGEHNQRDGFRYAPLVESENQLHCSLSILFLRMDSSIQLLSAGDIDNRVKTLIDALQIPRERDAPRERPGDGENPFHCLLQNDRDISALAVETDHLLGAARSDATTSADNATVHLVITVDIRPYYTTERNAGFA